MTEIGTDDGSAEADTQTLPSRRTEGKLGLGYGLILESLTLFEKPEAPFGGR
jgi:hypothetical protein